MTTYEITKATKETAKGRRDGYRVERDGVEIAFEARKWEAEATVQWAQDEDRKNEINA